MKKFVAGLILVLGLGLSLPAAVRLGLGGGYARAFTASYGEGPAYGMSAAVDIVKFLALEIRVTRFSLTGDGATGGLSKGRLTSMPVELSLQARIPFGSTFTPYLGLGFGYAWNSFRMDTGVAGAWSDVGFAASESVKNGLVGLAAFGIDIFLKPWLVLNIEGRVFITQANGAWSMTDAATGARVAGTLNKLAWNSALAGLSLKWAL